MYACVFGDLVPALAGFLQRLFESLREVSDEVDYEPPWLSRRFLSLGKRGCGYAYTEDAGCSFD